MSMNADLARAWKGWARAEKPTEHFRSGALSSRAYDLECRIDHLATSVYSLVQGVFEGKPWRFDELVPARLQSLDAVADLLRQVEVPENDRRRYHDFLARTRELLLLVDSGRGSL